MTTFLMNDSFRQDFLHIRRAVGVGMGFAEVGIDLFSLLPPKLHSKVYCMTEPITAVGGSNKKCDRFVFVLLIPNWHLLCLKI